MSSQPLLPIQTPRDPRVGTLHPMMAAPLASQYTQVSNPSSEPYVHHSKLYGLTAPVATGEAAQIGYLPHSCARCGHDLRYMRQQELPSDPVPDHALSFVQRPDFLMPVYAELSDLRRYTILMVFCFTVLGFASIFKRFHSSSSLNYIQVPDYTACAMLTFMCFTGIGVYGLLKYWQAQSRKRSGRYTEALKAARVARDAALMAIGLGISLGITAAAMVKSS